MDLPVRKVLESPDEWIGKAASFVGHVVVTAPSHAFLAEDYDTFHLGERIRLFDGGVIADTLISRLPPYGGGDCLYDEEVSLRGILRKSGSHYEIYEISECAVWRDGVEVRIR